MGAAKALAMMVLFRIVSEPVVFQNCVRTSGFTAASLFFNQFAMLVHLPFTKYVFFTRGPLWVKVGYHLLVTREWFFQPRVFPFKNGETVGGTMLSSKHGNGTYLFTLWL